MWKFAVVSLASFCFCCCFKGMHAVDLQRGGGETMPFGVGRWVDDGGDACFIVMVVIIEKKG